APSALQDHPRGRILEHSLTRPRDDNLDPYPLPLHLAHFSSVVNAFTQEFTMQSAAMINAYLRAHHSDSLDANREAVALINAYLVESGLTLSTTPPESGGLLSAIKIDSDKSAFAIGTQRNRTTKPTTVIYAPDS